MNQLKNLKAGSKAALRYTPHRGATEVIDVVIAKVGRKYLQLTDNSRHSNYQYDIETGAAKSTYHTGLRLFAERQQIEQELEHQDLSDKLKNACRSYGKLPYSLNQLKQVATILHLLDDPETNETAKP